MLRQVQERVHLHVTEPKEGFSESFISKMTDIIEAATDNLLRSEGWTKFPEDIEYSHAELEAEVDMDELAYRFESWLDDRLNEINPTAKSRRDASSGE